MENHSVDTIIENLFYILPIVHKKLLRVELGSISSELSRLHLAIMGILSKNKLPISMIAKQLLIPKSQMTRLIDQLERLGIVERQPDTIDRRVINIVLTDAGQETLRCCKELVRDSVRKRLSSLTESELKKLADSLEAIIELGPRFE